MSFQGSECFFFGGLNSKGKDIVRIPLTFSFCAKLDSQTLANKIALFCSLFNRDDPFSVSENVLRERGKYAHNFQCVEICIEGKLCMPASGNEMYKVHDW